MQLFITDYAIQDKQIVLVEERVLFQLTKVLRAKIGDELYVQKENERVLCKISLIGKKTIIAEEISSERKEVVNEEKYIAVALPNKFEKAELIVQKCTEIGVPHIVFFPARYSVIKEISANKMERLEKISLEAVEQSWGWITPKISFVENISDFLSGKNIFIAHQDGEKTYTLYENENYKPSILLVGPEGGRHSDEENVFDVRGVRKISFGENILRTETAAILGGRILKNT